MLNFKNMKVDYCTERLKSSFRRSYGNTGRAYRNLALTKTREALDHITCSDALYHNAEHTIMVLLVGQEILAGKQLKQGEVPPKDWAEFTIALACHDIGYVRGVCNRDQTSVIATGKGDETKPLQFRGTDAVLAPFHVDRGKLYLRERLSGDPTSSRLLDVERIATYVEMTRFPVPEGSSYRDTGSYAGLVRAADYLGQFADPHRLQKCAALFYELEEGGLNEVFGYQTPGDLRDSNAKFYREAVSPYVQDALPFLRATPEGAEWIVSLEANLNWEPGT